MPDGAPVQLVDRRRQGAGCICVLLYVPSRIDDELASSRHAVDQTLVGEAQHFAVGRMERGARKRKIARAHGLDVHEEHTSVEVHVPLDLRERRVLRADLIGTAADQGVTKLRAQQRDHVGGEDYI